MAFCCPSWSGIDSHFYVLQLGASVGTRAPELVILPSPTHQDAGPAPWRRKWGPAVEWRGAVFAGYCESSYWLEGLALADLAVIS